MSLEKNDNPAIAGTVVANDRRRADDRLWDHEMRIRILERDYAEIKEIREDVKSMHSELASVKATVQGLPEAIGKMVKAEIAIHENVETKNQNQIMRYIVGLILTVIGSLLYLAGDKLIDFFLK